MPKESFQDMVPPSRIGIKLKVQTGDAEEEVEIPLRLLILGDFTLRPDSTELKDRKPVSINKDNFDEKMKSMNLGLTLAVPNKLADDGSDLKVDLKFESMKDFDPARVAEQIPALKRLLKARQLLNDLKARVKLKPEIRRELTGLMRELNENPDNEDLVKQLENLMAE
jgi:type VI secretion system protein ImpB